MTCRPVRANELERAQQVRFHPHLHRGREWAVSCRNFDRRCTHLRVVQVFGSLEELFVDLDFFAQCIANVFQRLARQVIVFVNLARFVFASETLGKGGRRAEQAFFDADPVLFEVFYANRCNSSSFGVFCAVVIVRIIIEIVILRCVCGNW